jgi:hypothetical protein
MLRVSTGKSCWVWPSLVQFDDVLNKSLTGLGQDGFGAIVSLQLQRSGGGAFALYSFDFYSDVDAGGYSSISGQVLGGANADLSVAVGTGDWLNLQSVQFYANGNGFDSDYAVGETDTAQAIRPAFSRPLLRALGANMSEMLKYLITACFTLLFFSFSAHAQKDFARTEALGQAIFLNDRAAWIATDTATTDRLQELNVKGYAIGVYEDIYTVYFITDCGGDECIALSVSIDYAEQSATLNEQDDLYYLEGVLQKVWQARKTAIASGFTKCTPDYNAVVLPQSSEAEPNWLVYLLAATTSSNEVILTGHHRITVSNDGADILRSDQLFNSCLSQEVEPQAAALAIADPLNTYPVETYVFTSMNYRIPIYVGTSEGKFVVDGMSIRQLDE